MSVPLVIAGSVFALFVPGFLVVLLLLPKLGIWEKIALSIAISIAVDISIGLLLGYDDSVATVTGGISTRNVWTWMIIITSFLLTANIVKYRNQLREFATKK